MDDYGQSHSADYDEEEGEGEDGSSITDKRMTLAEELMELQNGANMGGVDHDEQMAFDGEGSQADGEHTGAIANNHEDIFMASGFRRGMRQIAKELVRSGGDTDLASLVASQNRQ